MRFLCAVLVPTLTLDSEISRIVVIAHVRHPLHFFNCLRNDISMLHRNER